MREYDLKLAKYEQHVKSLETEAQARKIEFEAEKEKLLSDTMVSKRFSVEFLIKKNCFEVFTRAKIRGPTIIEKM